MRKLNAILVGLGIFAFVSVQAYTPDSFPRLATVNLTEPMNYDNPAYQASLARFNLMLFMIYPNWNSAHHMTMNQSVAAIKAINPLAKVYLYVLVESMPNPSDQAWSVFANELNSTHWWLYPQGTSGTPVPASWPGNSTANITLFVQPDANGRRWVDWYANYAVNNYIAPNPAVDGLFTDNVFISPRTNGDWNLDGVTDSDSNPTTQQWYQQGYAHYFNDLYKAMPGKYQLGNITDWGTSGGKLGVYSGMVNGGLIEGMIGVSWSPETWGGWSEMMRQYRQIMAATASPKLTIFSQRGSPTDYQGLRYGLASCLLDDGYFEFTNVNSAYSGVIWFDEYNVNLGSETSSPATSPWQKGVYRRDYQNGIALVNPKGNGPQTVQLETSYKRIAGTQDPAVNSGQVTNSVTLNDRDGIILLRLQTTAAPSAAPMPPANIVVH